MRQTIALLLALLLWIGTTAANAQSIYEEGQDDEQAVDTLELAENDSLAQDSLQLHLPWPQSLQAEIEKLLQNDLFELSQVGLMVYDLDADSILFRHNERQRMRPASTMKVITAITALDCLGGSYQFRTQLRYDGSVDNNTLTGNLYCVGGMDPRFNNDDMKAFVQSLKDMGVDTIRGNVCADLSFKDKNKFGRGWCWDDDNWTLTPLLVGKRDVFMPRFLKALTSEGIVVEGDTVHRVAPSGSTYEICTRTHSIDQILARMMKESDNLYAESMFYQIAHATGQSWASARQARQVVNRVIARTGLKPSMYTVADGSGLSLYDYLTPELEVMMLRYAWRSDGIYEHLYPALSIAGVDGTLKSRMRGTFAEGNVHAKTGTVEGVRSLAGYAKAANGHTLAFCIINQGVRFSGPARRFQDRVCNAMCRP